MISLATGGDSVFVSPWLFFCVVDCASEVSECPRTWSSLAQVRNIAPFVWCGSGRPAIATWTTTRRSTLMPADCPWETLDLWRVRGWSGSARLPNGSSSRDNTIRRSVKIETLSVVLMMPRYRARFRQKWNDRLTSVRDPGVVVSVRRSGHVNDRVSLHLSTRTIGWNRRGSDRSTSIPLRLNW